MLKAGTEKILHSYCEKNPAVAKIKEPLWECVRLLCTCFEQGGQLLVCGNGGSCADADHIVGELVKAFKLKRPLTAPLAIALQGQGNEGKRLAENLQGGLPAINLGAHASLMTAVVNDMGGEYIYAQQVAAYGRVGDIFLGISTSGNAADVLHAGQVAKAKGMTTIGLTGRTGGRMEERFDLMLHADSTVTEDIQDQHSTIYHAICAAVEYQCWGD